MRVAGRLVDCVAATTGMPRGFAYATVMLTDESVLAVYSVHLKSNSGGIEETTPKREESARQLIAHCNGLKERDLLPVCGPLRVRRSGSISSIS